MYISSSFKTLLLYSCPHHPQRSWSSSILSILISGNNCLYWKMKMCLSKSLEACLSLSLWFLYLLLSFSQLSGLLYPTFPVNENSLTLLHPLVYIFIGLILFILKMYYLSSQTLGAQRFIILKSLLIWSRKVILMFFITSKLESEGVIISIIFLSFIYLYSFFFFQRLYFSYWFKKFGYVFKSKNLGSLKPC